MIIKLLAFGIAKDIIGGQSLELEVNPDSTVENIKEQLITRFPEFSKLKSLKLAVNGEYVEDQLMVRAQDEVVIIPPVSGG